MMYLVWIAVILIAFALYQREIYSRFSKYGVKHLPVVPIVGNLLRVLRREIHVSDLFEQLYYDFPEERFVGRYEFSRPILLLRDIELVKKVTVKDFEYFIDHTPLVDETMDPLFGRNLFSLKNQEWKDMRSTLSPAFTSSKMRQMVPFMMEVSEMMLRSLNKLLNESSTDFIDVDVKDLTTRYTNDVIASCAFGLKVDSHSEKDNEFYTIGKETIGTGPRKIMVFLGYTSFPKLMKKLKVRLFSERSCNFFRSIILNTMKEREAKHIIRPDMIQLLMEAKKGKLSFDEKPSEGNAGFATVEESHVGQGTVNRDWSDDDLVAQAVLFFIAGFDTVATTMSFLMHELALNPDVQERLAQEIKDHDVKNGGKFDFSSIQSMTYLDMVISEVLRRWPPAPGLDRLCVKDYNLGKPNPKAKEDYILRKGEALSIPGWCFQHDEKYFPDPYKFDPERFSEQNKHTIKPFTYLPFGLGPRNCIGSRFALCEVKVMTYQLLQQMVLSPGEKTQVNARLARDSFNVRIEGGHWVRFNRRK